MGGDIFDYHDDWKGIVGSFGQGLGMLIIL